MSTADDASLIDSVQSASSGVTTLRQTRLPAAKPLSPIPARSGAAAQTRKTSGTGGIASPLTETSYADREFYAAKSVTSMDGVFALSVRRLKTLKMTDANGDAVEMRFKDAP